jgi:hypothetical protein
MTNSTILTTIGLYLTLIGLLTSFFYIHLSNWLRDLFRLKAKWEINQHKTDPQQITAIRECRFELKGLYNHLPVLISIVISAFVTMVYYSARVLLLTVSQDPVSQQLAIILYIFFGIFIILTLYLLIHGYILGYYLSKKLTSN